MHEPGVSGDVGLGEATKPEGAVLGRRTGSRELDAEGLPPRAQGTRQGGGSDAAGGGGAERPEARH